MERSTIGSFTAPCCRGMRYGIHPPPIQAEAYEINIDLVLKIEESKFLGTKGENPYDHLVSFERLCNTFRTGGVPDDSIKLILFPFSLGGRANQWERMLPSHKVKSWEDCKDLFLNKFYPIQRTIQARSDILNFEQGPHESFNDAWDRLNGYTRDCPHHGFEKGEILSIFYGGVTKDNKWTLDVACNGSFSKLDVDQGELLVENLLRSFEISMDLNEESPLEDSCQGSNLQIFNDELDMRGRLENVEQLDALLAQRNNPNQVGFEGMHEEYVQEQWSSYEVQEVQQDFEMRSMLQHLLDEQAKLGNVLDEMEERIKALSSSVMPLHQENAQGCFLPSTPIINPNIDENENLLLKNENTIYGSQHEELMGDSKVVVEEKIEIEAPRVEYMGSYSILHVVSPPKAISKKKETCQVQALGYGNYETMEALDGNSLESLFSHPQEKEVEDEKEVVTLPKNEESIGDTQNNLDSSSNSITLTPWKLENDKLEYKVKCKGRSRPFAKVRALLSNEFKEKGHDGIQEAMKQVLVLKLRAPPWSDSAPFSNT